MNNSKSLLTTANRVILANTFVSSFSDSTHYFFAGNHLNSNTVPDIYDNSQDTVLKVYYNMIFGKRIRENDTSLMIRRVDWQSNTVYSSYDHRAQNLYDTNFYVSVTEGTQTDVFKCLENGSNSYSIVAPSRLNVNSNNDDFYYPSDGYRWKYMYSVSSANFSKFATPDFIPVYTDAGARASAKNGAIDVIKVENAGAGYSNYLTGTLLASDLRLNGSGVKYALSGNSVNTANDFYSGCYMSITSGAGNGQYRKIINYSSNSSYNFVTIENPFDISNSPENGSTYEIYPSVNIVGDGSETTAAEARAIINPSGNSISRIEILKTGLDYNLAAASVVYANNVGVTTEAVIVPIYSPKNGHGYDPAKELGGTYASVSVQLNGSESNTIPVLNDYSEIGIIKSPQFNQVTLNLANNNNNFFYNENVFSIDLKQLGDGVTAVKNGNNQLTNTLQFTSAVANTVVDAGDQIVIEYESNKMIANVVSTSNTYVVVDKIMTFDTANTANVYLARSTFGGLIDSFSANQITLTNVYGTVNVGDTIIGGNTGIYGTVSTVQINGYNKGFDTFVQCYRYSSSLIQGQFEEDELVYQISNNSSRAYVHSVNVENNTSVIYVTNQVGNFNTGSNNQIIGYNSGAIANISNKYLPDLVFGSGDIVYVENGDSITRADENSENFKIVFQF